MENLKINRAYEKALHSKNRYLVLYGGAGSGKSIFAGQKLIYRMLEETGHRLLIIRKVARTIKMSCYQLLKDLIYMYNYENVFTFTDSEKKIICDNGNEIVSCGVDDPEKLKSIQGITSIWIEEATELEENDFTQIDMRIRGKGLKNYKQIILTFNPISELHWLNNYKFRDVMKIKTTYKDNAFIDEEYMLTLENLASQNRNMYNIYALGEWGVLEELIYRPFECLTEYPAEIKETIYGLDFGFNEPTALVKIDIKDNQYYLTELLYETKLTNSQLIEKLKILIPNKSKYIYADSGEPARITEIHKAGFNCNPAIKSVKDGIDYCKSQKIFTNYDNINLNKELQTYSYKKDKNNKVIDEPVKFEDHLCDAFRYAIYSYNQKKKIRVTFV